MMSDTAYSAVPTGGVMTPKVTVVIMIMPNTTSLTPMLRMTGSRMGVRIRAITVVSMNIPQISRKTTTSSSRIALLLVMPSRAFAMVTVMLSNTMP